MNDDEFYPEDIRELEEIFATIEKEEANGFRMEFIISDMTADDMIAEWSAATSGDKYMMRRCWDRYTYIIRNLIDAVSDYADADDED